MVGRYVTGAVAISLALLAGAGCDDAEHSHDEHTTTDPTDSTDPTDPTGSCTQAADFMDVTGTSAGSQYAAPTLAASCTDTTVVVASNGIPNFSFDQVTPNMLTTQNFQWEFPRYPEKAAQVSAIPLGGASAIAVNGLPIFGPTEAPNDGYRDPILDELLDYCNGHTAPGGVYHFHARPDCLFTDMEGNTSLVLGYAFDGFPILAPYICEDDACTSVKKVQSSWQPIAAQFDAGGQPLYTNTDEGSWDIFEYIAGSGDLDACNGRDLPDGSYAYYATDTFPYTMGCYTGTPTANGRGGGGGPGGGGPGGGPPMP